MITKTARRFLSSVITYEKAAEIRKLAKAYPDLTRTALAKRFGCTSQTIGNILRNPHYRVDPRGPQRAPKPQTLADLARAAEAMVAAERKKEQRLQASRERAYRRREKKGQE